MQQFIISVVKKYRLPHKVVMAAALVILAITFWGIHYVIHSVLAPMVSPWIIAWIYILISCVGFGLAGNTLLQDAGFVKGVLIAFFLTITAPDHIAKHITFIGAMFIFGYVGAIIAAAISNFYKKHIF